MLSVPWGDDTLAWTGALMEPQLVVNGRSRPLGDVGAHLTLLEWLRKMD